MTLGFPGTSPGVSPFELRAEDHPTVRAICEQAEVRLARCAAVAPDEGRSCVPVVAVSIGAMRGAGEQGSSKDVSPTRAGRSSSSPGESKRGKASATGRR